MAIVKTGNAKPAQAQDTAFARLKAFEDEIRGQGTKANLFSHIVNTLPEFVNAKQAVLSRISGRSVKITDANDVSEISRESGYIQALERKIKRTLDDDKHAAAIPIAVEVGAGAAPLPFGLLLRLTGRNQVILLVRDKPWRAPEIELASYLSGVYAHALNGADRTRRPIFSGVKRLLFRGLIVAAIAALFLVQAKVSIVAPARVVPISAASVTAPTRGRIERVLIEQGDKVSLGETLFVLDRQVAQDSLSAAQQGLAVAIARQGVLLKQALTDPRARQELLVAEQEVKVAQIDVQEAEHFLERHIIRAHLPGTVLSEAPDQLLGEVVEVGETLTQIFDPHHIELEIDVPVSDGIVAYHMTGARVFLNVDPLSPLELQLAEQPKTPRLDDRGGVSYPVRLAFADETKGLIVGMEGSALIFGPSRMLIYTLLRRPINWLRVRMPVR